MAERLHHIFPHHELTGISGKLTGGPVTIWQWQDEDFNGTGWVWAASSISRKELPALPIYETAKEAEQAARRYYRGRVRP